MDDKLFFVRVHSEGHMRAIVKMLVEGCGYSVGHGHAKDFTPNNYINSKIVTIHPESKRLFRASTLDDLLSGFEEVFIPWIEAPKREILIDGNKVELSEGSFQALKAQFLKG